jgi:threonine dehydrogenase-like Zn-dependent dehydrogenase
MINAAAKLYDDFVGKKPVAEETLQAKTEEGVSMKAITWRGPCKVACETVPKPAISHPGDVIVKVTSCTICSGSDSHLYSGGIPSIDVGSIMGHEAMGIIESKGEDVKIFNVGDRVVIAFDVACGKCDACKRQEFTGCRETNDSRMAERVFGHAPSAIFGYSRLLGNLSGSQAEYVRVPLADVNCYRVPDEVPDEKALFLSDVLCTSLHAVDMGDVKEGSYVCIWGLGPIGLCAARWCQIRGARRIMGIDMVPERLQIAEKVLGIEVVDRSLLTSETLTNRLLELQPEGFDVTIEAAGFRYDMSLFHKIQRAMALETDTPEILLECFKLTRPYGTVSIIGDYVGTANQFPIGFIMMKHLKVNSGQCPCQKYFDYVMEKVRDGTFDPTYMISHRINFEEIPAAYDKLYHRTEGFIKVFVEMN